MAPSARTTGPLPVSIERAMPGQQTRPSPQDLAAWQARMGISTREAARGLGVAPATYLDWLHGRSRTTGKPTRPTHVVGLACAALEAGLQSIAQADDPPSRRG